jgi:hypothetical protein
MFSRLFNKVFLFFNKFKPLAGQVNFFSCVSFCGFLELSAAEDEQLKIKQFHRRSQKHLKINLQSKKKQRKSNTSAQFPQSIIDQTIETSLKEKATRCS